MKKFSKINESKLELINDILLEIDIIDGIERFYFRDKNIYGYKPNIIEVNIFFKNMAKTYDRFIINKEKIDTLTEIFSVIQRLNDIGTNSYITYLQANSKHMVFMIEK